MNRCQVLIVDDEMIIRQGLTKLVEKKAMNWEIAGEARNGEEALAMLERSKPHLVITDIRMPMMDGIELARNIHFRHADTEVVILTGYKDFEYAQAAVRYGVLDFLLKPCSEEEVIRVLDEAYDKIMVRVQEEEKKVAEERLNDHHTLRSIMLRLPYIQTRLENVKSRILQKKLYLIKVSTYFPPSKSYGYNDMGLLQFAITNMAEEMLDRYMPDSFMLHVSYDVFALFIDESVNDSVFISDIQSTILDYLGIGVKVHRSGRVTDLQQLPDCMDALSGPNEYSIDQTKIRNLQNEIVSRIMLGQVDSVSELIEQHLTEMKALPAEDVKREAQTIAMVLHEMIKKEFRSSGLPTNVDAYVGRLHQLTGRSEILNWLERQKDMFLDELHQWLQGHNLNIIEKSIRYMEEHYMDHCDLKEVADYVHLSSNYFSNLFKKETGESFTNYITRIRMDKAKVLISNTEMRVFEIAQKVGYDDPNYFTTVFKQLTQMSPRQYRNYIREGLSCNG